VISVEIYRFKDSIQPDMAGASLIISHAGSLSNSPSPAFDWRLVWHPREPLWLSLVGLWTPGLIAIFFFFFVFFFGVLQVPGASWSL